MKVSFYSGLLGVAVAALALCPTATSAVEISSNDDLMLAAQTDAEAGCTYYDNYDMLAQADAFQEKKEGEESAEKMARDKLEKAYKSLKMKNKRLERELYDLKKAKAKKEKGIKDKRKAKIKQENAMIKRLEAEMERKKLECKAMKEDQFEIVQQRAVKAQQDETINAIVNKRVSEEIQRMAVAKEQEQLRV